MAYDIYQLMDFEDQIEPAARAAVLAQLAAAGVTDTVQLLVTRDPDDLATPRIEFSFSLSQSLTQRTTAGQAVPKAIPNAFEGKLSAVVVTTRPLNAADLHGRLRGVVRWAFAAGARAFTDVNLPYLQILEMLPEAQSPRVIDEKEQDVSALNYHIWFAVRQEAWPAT